MLGYTNPGAFPLCPYFSSNLRHRAIKKAAKLRSFTKIFKSRPHTRMNIASEWPQKQNLKASVKDKRQTKPFYACNVTIRVRGYETKNEVFFSGTSRTVTKLCQKAQVRAL